MVSWNQVQEAAVRLGIASRGGEAEGFIHGRPVSLKLNWIDQKAQILVSSRLEPPLDLGLEMHRRQVILIGGNVVSTGSDDLDIEFSISGDDPVRVRELFDAPLREHLVALHRASYDFRLRDGGCTLWGPYDVDEAWIVGAANGVAQTVALLDNARTGLRPAAPLSGHAEALRTFATAHGLAFRGAPLAVTGRIDGRTIEIGSARTGRGRHHLAMRARFEVGLGLDLSIRREKLLDGLRTMLGGQDVLVGEEAFDGRFLVRIRPAQAGRAPALFDQQVRAALLALDERAGPVFIDDGGVRVEPIAASVEPETVVWAVDTLDGARARIERNLLHGGEGGPYR